MSFRLNPDFKVISAALACSAPSKEVRSHSSSPPIAILGIPFDNVTADQAITLIEDMVASRDPHYLVTANVDFLVQAQTDLELRRILCDAHLVLCDGTPLLWASRLLGNPLAERVAGADLVPRLIQLAAKRKYRLFLLGATPESCARAMANLRRQYKGLLVAGHSPPFKPLLEMDHESIKQRILEAQPDLLFVALGCPKQEKWIAMHYRELGVPVAVGVGATIDFLAGQVKRAPVWMQRSGTEWIFRLAQEPRRLAGRYARDLLVFSHSLLRQRWQLCPRPEKTPPLRPTLPGNSDSGPITQPEGGGCYGQQVISKEPSYAMERLPERLDLAATLEREFPWQRLVSERRDCLLDSAGVKFIDSTGVGILIQLQKRCRSLGRQLILVAPSAAVVRALRLMRLKPFFATAPDLAAAEGLLERHKEESGSAALRDGHTQSACLRWQGELTAANAEAVWKTTCDILTDAAASSEPEVSIDLSALRFLDSSGLGVMVRAKKLAHRHGTKLVFRNVQPAVQTVLRAARLEPFLLGELALVC